MYKKVLMSSLLAVAISGSALATSAPKFKAKWHSGFLSSVGVWVGGGVYIPGGISAVTEESEKLQAKYRDAFQIATGVFVPLLSFKRYGALNFDLSYSYTKPHLDSGDVIKRSQGVLVAASGNIKLNAFSWGLSYHTPVWKTLSAFVGGYATLQQMDINNLNTDAQGEIFQSNSYISRIVPSFDVGVSWSLKRWLSAPLSLAVWYKYTAGYTRNNVAERNTIDGVHSTVQLQSVKKRGDSAVLIGFAYRFATGLDL